MKMLETIHILPVRAESAAPAPLRGKKLDQRAVLQVVRKVDWKKAGLIAGGVTIVCAAAGTASRYKFYQGIVARELKKQLAPLNDKLDALQAENRKEEIDRMQAGTEKKLAQIEYDYNARKEEINRQEADWKRENKEAGLSFFQAEDGIRDIHA